jgi:hypothetical protein
MELKQDFSILMDPKVEAQGLSAQDLEVQQRMQRKVLDLLSEARQFEASLEKEIKGLKKQDNKSGALVKKEAVLEQLQNAKGAYPQQMLLSQIGYLQYAVGGNDQLPGKDAQLRLAELQQQLKNLKADAL